jgi:hypothetical protein
MTPRGLKKAVLSALALAEIVLVIGFLAILAAAGAWKLMEVLMEIQH